MKSYLSFKIPAPRRILKSTTKFFGIMALALGVTATGTVFGLVLSDAHTQLLPRQPDLNGIFITEESTDH